MEGNTKKKGKERERYIKREKVRLLEKAYDRVNREALWRVLHIYDVGGQLLKGIQAFYQRKFRRHH